MGTFGEIAGLPASRPICLMIVVVFFVSSFFVFDVFVFKFLFLWFVFVLLCFGILFCGFLVVLFVFGVFVCFCRIWYGRRQSWLVGAQKPG